jgi:DUF4097 and DUF4098 domain-containing protein YvlB
VHYAAGSGRNRIDVRVASDGTFQRGGFFGLMGRGVNVSTYRGDLEAWADLRVLVPEGRDVEVHVGLGEMLVEGVRGTLRLDTRGGAVRTAGTVGRLAVSTGSGSIEVRGAEGTIDLDTGSGAIRVSDVTGSSLGMDTGSGSVEADNLTVDRLNVDTGSGRVQISAIAAADVMVDTGSGSVTLGLLRDVDQLDVETGSGRVEISVPATLGADVSVSTGSGRIDTEIPLQLRTARRNRLEGTFGDGAGRIRISTGSGGVGIREN